MNQYLIIKNVNNSPVLLHSVPLLHNNKRKNNVFKKFQWKHFPYTLPLDFLQVLITLNDNWQNSIMIDTEMHQQR